MSKEKQIEETIEYLNNAINVERNSYFGKGCITMPLIEADKILDILQGYRKQSEDTVEVVRCKDCVYFKQSVSALFPHASAFVCDCPYGLQKNVSENDFCCHGAKMKGVRSNGKRICVDAEK